MEVSYKIIMNDIHEDGSTSCYIPELNIHFLAGEGEVKKNAKKAIKKKLDESKEISSRRF